MAKKETKWVCNVLVVAQLAVQGPSPVRLKGSGVQGNEDVAGG